MFNQRDTAAFICVAAAFGMLLAASANTVRADIIHVYEGESIQAAINIANNGDEIIVHPGIFNEDIDFIGKAVNLHSSDGPSVTTISHPGPGPGRVVVCTSGEGADSVLQGFTITGGEYDHGAGMYIRNSSPTVKECWFEANTATYYAAGLDIFECASPPTVTDCRFVGNTAALDGGAAKVQDGTAILTNCVFIGNTCGRYGAAMYNEHSTAEVTNCTFSGNSAIQGAGGGMYNSHNSSLTVANCILWGDTPDEILNVSGSTAIVTHCDVQGGYTGTGNINADPLFVDPVNGDYHLAAGSPRIDAGHNWRVPVDDDDYDEDGTPASCSRLTSTTCRAS